MKNIGIIKVFAGMGGDRDYEELNYEFDTHYEEKNDYIFVFCKLDENGERLRMKTKYPKNYDVEVYKENVISVSILMSDIKIKDFDSIDTFEEELREKVKESLKNNIK